MIDDLILIGGYVGYFFKVAGVPLVLIIVLEVMKENKCAKNQKKN